MNNHTFRDIYGTELRQETACYGGKWTLEEEEYFHALREEFRAGTMDIPNGTTLRCFLAKKLGCKPKRITKKFENTGYNGKLPYVKAPEGSTPQLEVETRRGKLAFLELKFKKSRETLLALTGPKTRNMTSVIVRADSTSKRPPTPDLVRAALLAEPSSYLGLGNLQRTSPASFLAAGGSILGRSPEVGLPPSIACSGNASQQVAAENLNGIYRSLLQTHARKRQNEAESDLIRRLLTQHRFPLQRQTRSSPISELLSERSQLWTMGTTSTMTPILTGALDLAATTDFLPSVRAVKRARTDF